MSPDPMKALAERAALHFRKEATLNRNWAEGRIAAGAERAGPEIARRLEIAQERDHWAAAIETLATRPKGTA